MLSVGMYKWENVTNLEMSCQTKSMGDVKTGGKKVTDSLFDQFDRIRSIIRCLFFSDIQMLINFTHIWKTSLSMSNKY